jgi:nickel-dependent lactate racemase
MISYSTIQGFFMTANIVSLKVNSWYNDDNMEISFPDKWNVVTKSMMGHYTVPLSSDEVEACIRKPIVSRSLSCIAEGKKSAVIVFSDLTRGDDPKIVLPYILDELHRGGIRDDEITFISGLGAHGTMTRLDWAKKLGEETVSKYYVFNHNVYDHFKDMGTTSRGTPVEMNKEYASADVKIAIGGIIAHAFAGFGGGAKGVFPAVASIESIVANHKMVAVERRRGGCGYGVMKNNVVRHDMEEAARLAGLDFKVDMVYNNNKMPLGVFAGDFIEGHRRGVEYAKKVLTTIPEGGMDVVIANSYPGEAAKATWAPNASLKEGGTAVIIHNYIQGSVHHNIYGQFGRDYGGPMGRIVDPENTSSPVRKAGRVIYVGKWHSKKDTNPSTIWVKTWQEVLELLKEEHKTDTNVAVYPYCALQMPPFPPHY